MQKLKNAFSLLNKAIKALNIREKIVVFISVLFLLTINVAMLFDLFAPANDPDEINYKETAVYSEGLVGYVKVLSPLFVDYNTVDRSICRLIYSGLTKYDPLTKEFVSDLATFTVSEDKKKYIFTLKDGIKWHDGEKLTIDDVLFTYSDIIKHPDFPNKLLRSAFMNVEIKKENDRQISFNLKDKNNFFLSTTNIGIIPKHIFKDIAPSDIMKAQAEKIPVGTGPYMVNSAPKGHPEEVIINMDFFKDYYGEVPKFKKVVFKVYPSWDILLKNLNRVHMASRLNLEQFESLKNPENYQVATYTLPQYMAIFFNMDSDLLRNAALRKILIMSVDKTEILGKIKGKIPIDTPFLDLIKNENHVPFNKEEAALALEKMGWSLKSDATDDPEIRRDKKGEKLVLRLIVQEMEAGSRGQLEQQQLVGILKEQMLKVGIELRDEYYILPELDEKIKLRNYDMVLLGVNLGYNIDSFAYFHSSQTNENGHNFSNFRSFEADSLLINLREAEKKEECLKILSQLNKVIQSEYPAIFLYSNTFYMIFDKRLEGVSIKNLKYAADRFAYFDKWYIK